MTPAAATNVSACTDERPTWRAWAMVGAVCLAVWALARWLFFVGYEGSDDMFYLRFAALWHRTPVNHWEARLLGNAVLRPFLLIFGVREWAAVLPAMLASLTVLISTLFACRLYGTIRQAWWAGLFVALVPVEVANATTVSAHAVMAGFMAAGTLAFVRAADSRPARWLAAVCLPLGVVAHYNGSYYVASLLLAALIVDRRKYGRAVLAVIIGGVLAMLGEMLAFQVLFGDALRGLRLSSPKALEINNTLESDGLTRSMMIWSLVQFTMGHSFGVALMVTTLLASCCYRRFSPPVRIMALGAGLFWLVLSFGSYVPWDYRPFWRNARYFHPLVMPVAVAFAAGLVQFRFRQWARAAGVATLCVCGLMLSLGGSWGQNVTISRELLDYVLAHPDRQFVTDVHTANEIYVLNGLATPPNVAGTTDYGRTHYLDGSIRLVSDPAHETVDAWLINPLNVARNPKFARICEPFLGPPEYQTDVRYRALCEWIRPLRSGSWAVRKPPACVCRIEPAPQVRACLEVPDLTGQCSRH